METHFVVSPESERLLCGERRTAEYVVANPLNIEVELKSGEIHRPQDIRERVVRCRDCVHWRRPTDREGSRCTGAMAFVEPTPDGFCAWGKPREED